MADPEATIQLNTLDGGAIDLKNGWWASTGVPTPPVMTRGY